MKRILVSIDENVHEQIRLVAFNERKSISKIIREWIAKGLQSKSPRGKSLG